MGSLFKAPKPPPPPEVKAPEAMPVPDDKQVQLASQKRAAKAIYQKGRESTVISGKTKLN